MDMQKLMKSKEPGYETIGSAQWLGRNMPHEVYLPVAHPPGLDDLDAETLRAEMQKGLDDFAAGRVAELSAFRLELEKEGRI